MPRELIKYKVDLTGVSRDNLVINEVHLRDNLENRIILPDAGAFYADSMVVSHLGTPLKKDVDWKVAEGHEEGIKKSGKQVNFFVVLLNSNITDQVELIYQAYGDDGSIINNVMREYLLAIINNDYKVSFKDIVDLPVGFNPQEHYHNITEVNGWKPVMLALENIRAAILAQRGTHLYKIYAMIADCKTYVEEEVTKVKALQGDTYEIDALIKRLSDSVDEGMAEIENTVTRLIASSELSVQMANLQKTLTQELNVGLARLSLVDDELRQSIVDARLEIPKGVFDQVSKIYVNKDLLTKSIADFINRTDLNNALSLYATADALNVITAQITDKVSTDTYLEGISNAAQSAVWEKITDRPRVIQLHNEMSDTEHLNTYVGYDKYGVHFQVQQLNNGKNLGYPTPAINGNNNATSYPGQLFCYPFAGGGAQEYSYIYQGKYYRHVRVFNGGNWTLWQDVTGNVKGFIDPTGNGLESITGRNDVGRYLIRRDNNVITTLHASWPALSHVTLASVEGGRIDVMETGAGISMTIFNNQGETMARRGLVSAGKWGNWVDTTVIDYAKVKKPKMLFPQGVFEASPNNQFQRGVFGERWWLNNNGTVTISGQLVFAYRTDRTGILGPTEAISGADVSLFYMNSNRVVVWNNKNPANQILPAFNKWNSYNQGSRGNFAIIPIKLPSILVSKTERILDAQLSIGGFPMNQYNGNTLLSDANRNKVSTRVDDSNRPVDNITSPIKEVWTLANTVGAFGGESLIAHILNSHSLNLPSGQEKSGLIVGVNHTGTMALMTDYLYLLNYTMTIQLSSTLTHSMVDLNGTRETSPVQYGLTDLNLGTGSLMGALSTSQINPKPFNDYL